MMKRICCIVLILLPFGLFAQMNVTGVGFIDFISEEWNNGTSSGTGELDLYTNPNGDTVGCLQRQSDRKYFVIKNMNNQNEWKRLFQNKIGLYPFKWEDYYADLIQYYEEKNGFVRVKFDDKNYWIKLDELAANDGQLIPWKSYFPAVGSHLVVLYKMNLRIAPTVNSEKIMLVKKPQNEDGFHIIEPTGNIQGNWAEVDIHIIAKSDYCRNGYRSVPSVKGWIKHLDDKGFPNIFPARILCGC